MGCYRDEDEEYTYKMTILVFIATLISFVWFYIVGKQYRRLVRICAKSDPFLCRAESYLGASIYALLVSIVLVALVLREWFYTGVWL